MSDLISRQAVIDEIKHEIEMCNYALDSLLDFNARERIRQRRGMAREILNSVETMPHVEPARKQGKWIWNDHYGVYRCEKCGQVAPQEDQYGCYMGCSRFCPNCGADMRKEANK